jgi:alpha-glucosidase
MGVLNLEGSLAGAPGGGVAAKLSDGFSLRLDVLEDWLVRVAVVPDEGLAVDRTWMIAPGGDVPWEGRDRLAKDGFPCPATKVDAASLSFRGGAWRVDLEAAPLRLTFSRKAESGWQTVLADRRRGAYLWLERQGTLRHYQARHPTDRHFGLGDKTGPLDRTGRRFRLLQTDSLGYDAERSDPLYKHAPFFVAETAEGEATGLLYDSLSEMAFDFGAEHSNYYEHYRHVDAFEKGLVYYVIAGPKVSDVVPRLMQLTGKPHFPPRWSMGFAFTTMHHADDPKAQAVITNFAETCRGKGIPISAIHSGSGYTLRPDGRRYVFTWSADRFPDRDGFFRRLGELGFRTCANIKPVLLTGHPAYEEGRSEGWFVRHPDGSPAVEMFWGGPGSSLDFTNRKTVEWWKDQVKKQILGAGFTAAWNDNNEAELWDETAGIDGGGKPLPAIDMRPVHALLMTRASFEATGERDPQLRPYTVSRAGPIGIARYAETWSGDNRTSWHTLKWNLRMGLSMSLSGMPFVGHDIGGFDGPKPGPELLVRWFQMMALHPRALMNSWKPRLKDPTNLPWMHPEVVGEVVEALRLRYRFLPLLYNLAWRAHGDGTPLIAPLFYHFDEAECRRDLDQFMLGPDVLAAPVVEPGRREVSVYLPGGALWHDFRTGDVHEGGRMVVAGAPLDCLPLFVRSGAILPLAESWPDKAPHDADRVALTLFAGPEAGENSAEILFDDGESWSFRDRDASLVLCKARWNDSGAELTLEERWSGRYRPEIVGRVAGQAERGLRVAWANGA